MPLTDRRIAQLGKQYSEAQAALKAAERIKEDIKNKIIPEFIRRGTKAVEGNGVKVTKVTQTRTVYNWGYLKGKLTARQLRSIQMEAVDPQKLAEALQEGKIDPVVVAAATEIIETSSYLNVSLKSL